MIDFYTYDQYGNIGSCGTCQPENLDSYTKDGWTAVEGKADGRAQYRDMETGLLCDYTPEQAAARMAHPGYGFVWRYGQWVDERTNNEKKEHDNAKTKVDISKLESGQARAVREAILYGDTSLLVDIENQIKEARKKLK